MARRLITALASFILFWPLVGYPATLWLLARLRPRNTHSSFAFLPSMTVIVPTYNESANIAARIRNLTVAAYPRDRLDVIVVDSGSVDGTADLAEQAAREDPQLRVRVIRQLCRAGKADAINEAIRASTSELVTITDAPTMFEPDALTCIAAEFADPHIGAATGHFEVAGAKGAFQREEARFWRVRNALRDMEAAVDSTPFLSGELCCFRRRLVPALHVDTLADDVDVALQVRRCGYRVAVTSAARFSEPRSAAPGELTRTKSRRAAGGIQELIRGRDLVFSSRHGLFGMLILPSAWLYYLPLRVPAAAIVAIDLLLKIRRLPRAVQVAAAVAGIAALPWIVRRYGEQAGMLVFNEWIFLLGWWRVVSRRMDVRWTQERSTREAAEQAEAPR